MIYMSKIYIVIPAVVCHSCSSLKRLGLRRAIVRRAGA